jgi:hypothetical protein
LTLASLTTHDFWLCRLVGHRWIEKLRNEHGNLMLVFCQRCGRVASTEKD